MPPVISASEATSDDANRRQRFLIARTVGKMARSGTRSAVRGIDLRALRARRDAVPVSNAFSSHEPDPATLVEAQKVADQIRAGDPSRAYTILRASASSLRTGRPALAMIEQAVLERWAKDKYGEVIEGFARRYLTALKVERRDCPHTARASYQGGAAVHLRRGVDEKGRFQSFCGRSFWPVPVRRGQVVAAALDEDDRPVGMFADICRRCAPHLSELPDQAHEPVNFRVLDADERRLVELAALTGFCEHADGVPEWRMQRLIAATLPEIAIERASGWGAAEFDRNWLRDALGLRSGFVLAYGDDRTSWPTPDRLELEKAVRRHPAALVLERSDERIDVLHRKDHDELMDDLLPSLLGSVWAAARDACRVRDVAEIKDGIVGDTDRRLREILSAAGRSL